MIKVRFNLGKGKNYKKWKITFIDKSSIYVDPKSDVIFMHSCKLKNNRTIADKIFNGANKSVCAWIECKKISIVSNNTFLKNKIIPLLEIKYNPRNNPYWTDYSNNNIDSYSFEYIKSNYNKLYIGK